MRLHERQPGAAIDVLAPAWSAPLLARMPEVAAASSSIPSRHGQFDLAGRRALGRRLATADFRPGLSSCRTPGSRPCRSVLRRHSAAHRLHGRGARRACSTTATSSTRPPCRAWSSATPRWPAARRPAPDCPDPRPALRRPNSSARARAALGLPLDVAPIIFCPGAEYGPAKRWPARHFAALARKSAVAAARRSG